MSAFEVYVSKIEQDLQSGKATEYTYRSTLEALIKSLANDIVASNDTKLVECGATDFIVEKRTARYIR